MWSQGDLSLSERILTTTAFGIANLLYALSLIDADKDVITSSQ